MSFALNEDWDIYPDASGNLALCKPAVDVLQNVATACQMWLGENWYNVDQGLPYDTMMLGTSDVTMIVNLIETQANDVDGVEYAICYPTKAVRRREMRGVLAVKVKGHPKIGYVKI